MVQRDTEGGQTLALNVPGLTKAEEGEKEITQGAGIQSVQSVNFWFTTGAAVKQEL